ncbi:MAG: hypothetical protein IPK10_15330 [Bacteroidetes bacterium]|nr:hypothetical protein [Bacteroidota bacterium]
MEYFNGSFATEAPDNWIYFESNVPNQLTDISYILIDPITNLPIVPEISPTYGSVFKIGSVIKGTTRTLHLFVDWSNCPAAVPGNPNPNFEITAKYGTNCRVSPVPIPIDNIILNTCSIFTTYPPYEIERQASQLAAVLGNYSQNWDGCSDFIVPVTWISSGGDLSNAIFNLIVPNGLQINYASTNLFISAMVGTQLVSLPMPPWFFIQPIQNGNNWEYNWDLLALADLFSQIGHFNSDSDPNAITLNLVFSANSNLISPFAISCGATAQDKCGVDASFPTQLTNSIQITGTPPPAVSIVQVGQLCNGNSVQLNATPGFTSYLWSNGLTSSTINVNSSGIFTVTATDANGCLSYDFIEVLDGEPIVNLSTTSHYCSTSSVPIILSNDDHDPFYTYLWSNSLNTSSITVTAAGIYSVTVTGPNGCSVVSNITVHDLSPGLSVAIINGPDFCATSVSPLELVASTQQPGSTYLWNTLSTSSTIYPTPISTTTFIVTATNMGCSESISTIVSNITPTVYVTSSHPLGFCGSTPVDLTANSSQTTYSWSHSLGSTQTVSVSPMASTTYTVTVSDPTGCTAQASYTVENIEPNVTINNGLPYYICPLQSGTLYASADPINSNGGAINYTYQWTPGNQTNQTLSVPNPSFSQPYTVIATNTANQCTATSTFYFSDLTPHVNFPINPIPVTFPTPPITLNPTISNCIGCTYVWYEDPLNNIPIPGCTTATCIVSPATTTQYCVHVTSNTTSPDNSCTTIECVG